jgi:phenylacetate-CoA ligase
MSLVTKLKPVIEKLPPVVGACMSFVPYSWRLGPALTRSLSEINQFKLMTGTKKKECIFERIRALFDTVYTSNAFFRNWYETHGVTPQSLQCFDDISYIPVISKTELQAVPLTCRSIQSKGAFFTNTGGTSGQPLAFYLDKDAFAREWAYMHEIWQKLCYNTWDKKLTFRGKNLGDIALKYNAVHNEYHVNGYVSAARQADAIEQVINSIRYIHGYPSSIYEFVRWCSINKRDLLSKMRKRLKGILFGSEYPAPVYRNLIEKELEVATISWYGHSEMAVLAYETQRYEYVPFHSYGFCEAIKDTDGRYHLVGTSYYNMVSPFIRYDTGDEIEPVYSDGLLRSFRVVSGRIGESITDASGNRISLTAFIFGRHHTIFQKALFVQVRQNKPGIATLIVTMPDSDILSSSQIYDGFDMTNIDVKFDIEVQNKPYRTRTGKIPLLIRTPETTRS